MQNIREQAIALINEASEDDLAYFVYLIENQQQQLSNDARRALAWKNLQKYHKRVQRDIDCKAELAQYWEERYANPGLAYA